ncbi:MAG: hypothetical protein IJG40_00835 [Oscillospiraceae bacterium]|nr:hypothetical protein [Oscillospiraceae bacterium]
MTYKRAVRDLRSEKPIPPKIFDAIVDETSVRIEIKPVKEKSTFYWDDIRLQMEKIVKEAQKLE